MATARVERPEAPLPPATIHLELTEREALVLETMLYSGDWPGTGENPVACAPNGRTLNEINKALDQAIREANLKRLRTRDA